MPPLAAHPLDRVVEMLVRAERPVVLADLVGRNESTIPSLVALAEVLGAPVVDLLGRFNMPSVHPLDATSFADDALRWADLLLALDVRDPVAAIRSLDPVSGQAGSLLRSNLRIISICMEDAEPAAADDLQRLQHVDLKLVADTSVALPVLVAEIRAYWLNHEEVRDRASERGAIWADDHRGQRARWRREAGSQADDLIPNLPGVVVAVWEVIKDDNWSLAGEDPEGWARRLWDFRHPEEYLSGPNGPRGISAAVGAALASRGTGRVTISFDRGDDLVDLSDALGTAARASLPMLVVLHRGGARSQDPASPDPATLAQSLGLHGEGPIARGADLKLALERAWRAARDEEATALVDVVCVAPLGGRP